MTLVPSRTAARGLAVALLLLPLAACGGDDDTATPAATSSTTSSSAPASSAPASSAPAASGTVLKAAVAKDAFQIRFTDAAGAPVTTLPAGTYTVQVDDPSTIHNVHLSGAGVDEKTSVGETASPTWQVTLTPGQYTYRCDPHPRMMGTFTVT